MIVPDASAAEAVATEPPAKKDRACLCKRGFFMACALSRVCRAADALAGFTIRYIDGRGYGNSWPDRGCRLSATLQLSGPEGRCRANRRVA